MDFIYFIFTHTDVVSEITIDIEDAIKVVEEEGYSFTLYKFQNGVSNPALFLNDFIESGELDYTTLTEEEYEKFKKL